MQRASRRTRLPPVVLAALAAFSSAAAEVEPCKVLTESDVRRLLGPDWKFVESVSVEEVCGYMGATNAFATLTLHYYEEGAAPTLAMRRKMIGDRAVPLDGPGDSAFRFPTPLANVLLFGKGGWVAQLDLTLAASGDTAILDRLAKRAYDRLP